MNEFKKEKYSYSSLFINYKEDEIQNTFKAELKKRKIIYSEVSHSLEEITFTEDHRKCMDSDKGDTKVELITVPLRSIKQVD